MAKLTYDQMLLVEGIPPIGLSKRNPYKMYAQFTTTEPVETIDIEDLRETLHNVSNDIADDDMDIMLVYSGTDKSPQYQIWVAAPIPIINKLQQKFLEARNFVKYLDMFHYATKCQYIMEPSLQEMMTTNKMVYSELTKRIGFVDDVHSRYSFNISSEEAKRIIEVMFTTGHNIHNIIDCDHESKMDFGFGFALDDSDADKIYFQLLDKNRWEVQIYASTAYCHFLKVAEIALPCTITSKCVKSHMASNDSYSKCETMQKYIQESIEKSYRNRTPKLVAMATQLQQNKIKELVDRGIMCAYFDDEKTSTTRVKIFIDHIIKVYSGAVDISIKFTPTLEKYEIVIKFTDDIRTRFVPCDDDKWVVEIFSPDMIALYSIAVNESISELFPECK